MPQIIKVNRNVLDRNRKHGFRDPVITATVKGKALYGDRMIVHGPSQEQLLTVAYTPDREGPETWMAILPNFHTFTVHRPNDEPIVFGHRDAWAPTVHVHREAIDENQSCGTQKPVMTIFWKDASYHAECIVLRDAKDQVLASIVYDPESPQKCGARVWVEVENHCSIRIQNGLLNMAMPGAAIKAGKRFHEWLETIAEPPMEPEARQTALPVAG